MRESGQEGRVCDGVVDCPDFSDELYCDYCPEKHFHCGVGSQCIDKMRMCDGVTDCDNGADERGCGEFMFMLVILILISNFCCQSRCLLLCQLVATLISIITRDTSSTSTRARLAR